MSDTILSCARDHLLPLLMEAADMIRGFPKEVAELKDELKEIQDSIHEAVRMAAIEEDNKQDRIKKRMVKQMMEAAFHLEDAIDEYINYEEQEPRALGCAALPCEAADLIKTMSLRLQIAYKIRNVKSRIDEIKERSKSDDGSQIQSSLEQGQRNSRRNQNVTLQNLQEAPIHMEKADVVGFEAPTAQLIDWLENGKRERTVISVVGMGGQGKTTLVRKIFYNRKVIKTFDCCAWITVPQSDNAQELLRDMLHKFCKYRNESPPQGISTMNREALIEEVGNYLRKKRYVVFFDDVWDTGFWDEIEFSVIDNKIGSRILITTRNMDVVMSRMKSSLVKVHELQPLTPQKSLELFCKTAFCNLNGDCREDLMNNISSEIVEKCKGLPLAIVAIGGVLSGRQIDSFGWKRFSQNLSAELQQNSRLDVMGKILGISYDDLPYHLKSCFLYFGMYPEDYKVRSKRLIRQWIAEGFVKEELGKNTLEDVAEGYLTELISRNLVQVSSVYIEGKVKTCGVHDLLREMILRKCKDLSFCHYVSGDDQSMSGLSGINRRLSIATTSRDLTRSFESSPIRSLLFYTDREIAVPENLVRRISTKYMLKVLDFEDARLKHVPQNLGNLIHLKYLSFRRNGGIESLPKSIGKLQNLETLNIKGTRVCDMPKEISKLKKLRHILADFVSLIQLRGCIGGMESLQTLSVVHIDDEGGVELIEELGMLRQLRELGLRYVRKEHGRALCTSINEMQHLEKLFIDAHDEVIDLNFISSPPMMLRRLSLSAKLNKLPEWIPKLENLVKLTLKWSNLAHDPLKSLQNMPNLLTLNIWHHSYKGKSLHFQDGGFKKLKRLHLKRLENLNSIIINGGALQSLETFFLSEVFQLETLPTAIQHLKKLEHLLIDGRISPTIEQSIAPDAQGHQIIKHLPLVELISYKERITYRLGEIRRNHTAFKPCHRHMKNGDALPVYGIQILRTFLKKWRCVFLFELWHFIC